MKNSILKQLEEFYPNKDIKNLNEIRYKDGIFVGSVEILDQKLVVKYFENPQHAVEIKYYKLLNFLGVPTPKFYYASNNLLVMENLNFNTSYHLATADDLKNKNTITALARWYKTLHTQGEMLDLTNFYSELDFITKENLESLKAILQNSENLDLMLDNYEQIKNKINTLPLTITYNDFAEENMIAGENFAMMYDHNKMGKGLRFFDIQNVCFMLDDDMKKAFCDEYGEVPEIEKVAYNLLIPFITLIMASKMPKFPGWANPYILKAQSPEIKELLFTFLA